MPSKATAGYAGTSRLPSRYTTLAPSSHLWDTSGSAQAVTSRGRQYERGRDVQCSARGAARRLRRWGGAGPCEKMDRRSRERGLLPTPRPGRNARRPKCAGCDKCGRLSCRTCFSVTPKCGRLSCRTCFSGTPTRPSAARPGGGWGVFERSVPTLLAPLKLALNPDLTPP